MTGILIIWDRISEARANFYKPRLYFLPCGETQQQFWAISATHLLLKSNICFFSMSIATVESDSIQIPFTLPGLAHGYVCAVRKKTEEMKETLLLYHVEIGQ